MIVGAIRLPDYISSEEAAEALGFHVNYIRRMARNGKLRADKKAGIWWIYRDALQEYQKAIEGKAKHDPTRGH
jgi:excisionase family DNA binding protein